MVSTFDVLLFRYNNRTCSVDDIDWSASPLHHFKMSDGKEITYQEYYEQVQ